MYTHSGTHTCAHTHKERTRLLMCKNHKPDPICSYTARALGYQLSVMFAYIQHFHSSFWTFICQLDTAALRYLLSKGCQGTFLSKTISHVNLLWSCRTNSNFSMHPLMEWLHHAQQLWWHIAFHRARLGSYTHCTHTHTHTHAHTRTHTHTCTYVVLCKASVYIHSYINGQGFTNCPVQTVVQKDKTRTPN